MSEMGKDDLSSLEWDMIELRVMKANYILGDTVRVSKALYLAKYNYYAYDNLIKALEYVEKARRELADMEDRKGHTPEVLLRGV